MRKSAIRKGFKAPRLLDANGAPIALQPMTPSQKENAPTPVKTDLVIKPELPATPFATAPYKEAVLNNMETPSFKCATTPMTQVKRGFSVKPLARLSSVKLSGGGGAGAGVSAGCAVGAGGAGVGAGVGGAVTEVQDMYFTALWTKVSRKKHKVYDDGILHWQRSAVNARVTIYSTKGEKMGTTTFGGKDAAPLSSGVEICVGGKEIEVQAEFPADEFTSGRIFLSGGETRATAATQPKTQFVSKAFRSHDPSSSAKVPTARVPVSAHNPDAPCAVVLYAAKDEHECSVVIDPFVMHVLRPHQIAGVQFMYEQTVCVPEPAARGCILADEMGLGKTLQSICLVWTLLKQSKRGSAETNKALIVCPTTLVHNWAEEFKKWLGPTRVMPTVVNSGGAAAKDKVETFAHGYSPVLIISYEMLRKHAELLKVAKIGLLICDEGHRLKNSAGNKTIDALISVEAARRIILTATPIQNNLAEFHAMVSFIRPGRLGEASEFKRLFADPITKSRDPTCSNSVRVLGEQRLAELQRITADFVLRRTSDILEQYLPRRFEQVLFCRLSTLQQQLYANVIKKMDFGKIQSSGGVSSPEGLLAVGRLGKLCHHPSFVRQHVDASILDSAGPETLEWSGKMQVLFTLLHQMRDVAPHDRVVVVSNTTKALDLIQQECHVRSYNVVRLDGSTEMSARQTAVAAFNSEHNGVFVFLLSSKAGGVGLNLIGGNRLVMFDPCWNPATDIQAMARIWRDGQKKQVFIYRLISTGSIEEKIFQRQTHKNEMAVALAQGPVQSGGNVARHFTFAELKDIFTLRTDTECATWALLRRGREGTSGAGYDSCINLKEGSDGLEDPVVKSTVQKLPRGVLSFVMQAEGNPLRRMGTEAPAEEDDEIDPMLEDDEFESHYSPKRCSERIDECDQEQAAVDDVSALEVAEDLVDIDSVSKKKRRRVVTSDSD